MDRYLQCIEKNVESSTQNSKLNRVRQGVSFSAVSLGPEDLLRVQQIEAQIKNWSSVLGKEARRVNRARLEDLSEKPIEFGDVDPFLKHQPLHTPFHTLVSTAQRGEM